MKYKVLKLLILAALYSLFFVSNTYAVSSQRISIFFPDDGAKPYEKRAATFTQNTFFSAVLGQLLQVSASYDIEPGLIESYRWDFKENCYFLELRKGVTFHNGREATAADLEFTLIRSILKGDGTWESTLLMNILGADKLKSGHKYQPGMLEGINVISERRIRVTLASPNPAFLFTLTRSTISLVPREELEEDLNTWKRFPVGAGKYRVVSENETGSKVELEVTNKNETNIPHHVTLFTKGDYSSADILFGMVKNPDSSRFEDVINNSPFGVSILQFNFNSNIAKNDNFRMAVKYGINRKELLIGEIEKEPVYEILPATHWGRLNVKDPYDEQLAKSFLAKVPRELLKEEVIFPMYAATQTDFRNSPQGRIETQLRKIGIPVKLEITGDIRKFKSFNSAPLRATGLAVDWLDPLVIFSHFLDNGTYGGLMPKDKSFENLYKHASKAGSFDVKVESVKELSRFFNDKGFVIPLWQRKTLYLVNKKSKLDLTLQKGGATLFIDKVRIKK